MYFVFKPGQILIMGNEKIGQKNTPFSDDACVHTKYVETKLIVEMCYKRPGLHVLYKSVAIYPRF